MPPLPTIPTCTGEVHPVNGVAPDRVRRDDEPGARATLPRRIARAARALGEKWRRLRQGRVRRARFDRRRQERAAELERDNAALRQQLERCAEVEKELTRARNSAEAADAAKSAFLATMSHEIRTSLNGVIGMANLLRSSELDADQREMAETVCRCGETLLTIINDILDFSKIEAGRLELEAIDFDLVEQLQLAVELQSEPAQKKGLELIVDVDPAVPAQVRGDPVRLRQIVLNLVSNAIKFTAHGEIVLRVRPDGAPAAGPRVRFEVIDTGIGIAPDVQAALFQPFAQAEASTTRRFGGTGLGLAICKRLAGLMRGEIGVTSAVGAGSTFWFTVEFDRAREPLTPPAPPPALRGGRHVLIVDDNETNRKLLERLCVAWELPHGVAASAAAALAHLRWLAQTGKPFDLVLLDHHMPGVDGLALARAIRDDPLIPRPTLVMLSSRGERLTRAEMKANGIDACESKPIYPEKLRALLGRLLAPVAAVAKPAAPAGGLRAARPAEILVVEDNPLNQKVTLMQVRNLGHAADAAENGREAIAALRRKHYDVVLMDVHMPVMDGQEATRFIRRAQAAREPGFPCDLRIIATTASAQPEDRESCLRAGMDDFLTKPVQAEALQALLDRLLADSGPGAAGDGQRP